MWQAKRGLSPRHGVDLEEHLAAFVSDRDLKVRDFRRTRVRDDFHSRHCGFGASRYDVWQVSALGVWFDHAVSADIEIVARQ